MYICYGEICQVSDWTGDYKIDSVSLINNEFNWRQICTVKNEILLDDDSWDSWANFL